MHRTIRVPRFALGLCLFGLAVFAAATADAQPLPPPTPVQSVLVPRGSTVRVQMSTKKLIAATDQDTPGVVTIALDKADPKTALVTGVAPGISRATFTDVDGRKELFEFVVQTDVEYLKYMLRRAVPTATVEPIPSANNAFLLTGTVQKAEDVQIIIDTVRSVVGDRVINALRVGGVQQVELCVTIARVARSQARSMGFSFMENGAQHYISSILSSPLTLAGAQSASVARALGSQAGSSAAAAASSLSGSPNLIFGIINNHGAFQGFLEALRNQNLVKILAEPKLVTLSGRPAQFVSGGEQAVPQLASGSAGGGAVSGVDFKPFGTTVQFLPIVLGDGRIYLEVQPQFTFPDPSNLFSAPIPGTNAVVFGRTTQRVQTSIVLEDGQTFAVGGMVFRSVNGTATRVPFLGDLPFIGTAFSTINYTESEEELLVLVTPRLVDPLACNQLPKYLPGQETRSPDDFELFLERILEAPRGPRKPCPGGIGYLAAYRNDPLSCKLPCHGGVNCIHGRCDLEGGCPGSACGSLNSPPCCNPCGAGCGPNGCGPQGGAGGNGGNGGCSGCGLNGNGSWSPPGPNGAPGEVLQPMPAPGQAQPKQLPHVPVTTAPSAGESVAPAAGNTPAEGDVR
jgi:pilus assembly protein CpaC